MDIIIYNDFGAFKIPFEVLDLMGQRGKISRWDNSLEIRTNTNFLDWVRQHKNSPYVIVTIPPEATDYRILDYDGLESVIVVIDGKLVDL